MIEERIKVKESLEEKILELLKRAVIGLTTSDIAEKLGVSRLTIMRYLHSLKGQGLIVDKKIGAYKLWMLKSTIENKRKLISRKLACVLASVFLKVFGEKTGKIAYDVGKKLAKEFIEKYPEEYKLLNRVKGGPFTKIATAIEFISEGLKVNGIDLEEDRGIIHIVGSFCEDDVVSRILIILLKGSVVGFLEKEINRPIKVISEKVGRKNGNLEVILELKAE